MTKSQAQTLGQRIDTLLEPLYEEAEQHRATIAIVKEQQDKLQQQIDAAEAGLSQIETRMAEVVRAMAQEDPVIAAVVGESSAALQTPEPTKLAQTIDATPVTEPAATPQMPPAPEPEAAAEPEPEPEAETEPAVAEPVAVAAEPEPQQETEVDEAPEATVAEDTVDSNDEATELIADAQAGDSSEAPAEEKTATIELDPVADAAAVDEAAAILDAAPIEEAPKIDLNAAAERAAAAAKQLREKTGSN
jgi:hypothetical protein